MATFPSLTPSRRAYIPGDLPAVIQTSLSGSVSAFRRGNRRMGQTLQLGFDNLTESQVTEIRNHYDGQLGSYQIFFLSSECWAGYAGSPPVSLVSDFAWLYSSPPTIADGFTSRWNVEIELKTVPIDIGDLIFDGQDASDTWAYILEGGSATTSHDYIIDATGA